MGRGPGPALAARELDALYDREERAQIGVHTCPGRRRDSTHIADVDYAALRPHLFLLRAGKFYLQMASERDRGRVLRVTRERMRPEQMIFIGVAGTALAGRALGR